MTNIINIKNINGKAIVSSRDVAKDFEKRHNDVVSAIENKIENLTTEKFTVENSTHEKTEVNIKELFRKEEFEHNGNIYTEYLLTRDGFSFIVMGFTGSKADQWKLKYIQAFNRMEKALTEINQISEVALVNNLLKEFEEKLLPKIDERLSVYEENYRPTHANKIDLDNYIKKALGDDREDNEVDLVKTRALYLFGGSKWQDIPYEKIRNSFHIIDTSILEVRKLRTKIQLSLFEE